MGLMNESGNSDPSPGETGNRKSQNESVKQEFAAAADPDGANAEMPSSGISGDVDRAAWERLRIIRERIARDFYNRSGVKAKIAERLTGIEEIAQTWRKAVDEKQRHEKEDAEPSQANLEANDSEEQASENI